MTQLTPVAQYHETRTTLWRHAQNPHLAVEARPYPAKQIPKLTRADSQIVWVILIQERGSRAQVLGVLAESAPGLYRVICYGETPCAADESLDFHWQAGIDTRYAYHQERSLAASRRLTRLTDRQFAAIA